MPNQNDVESFKKLMGMLESTNNDNVVHRTVASGPQAGTTAIGKYGQMPNTIENLASRNVRDDMATPTDQLLKGASPDQITQIMKDNPAKQQEYATQLAQDVLEKTDNDVPASAAGWLYGHNLSANGMRDKLKQDPEYKDRINSAMDNLHLQSKPDEYTDKLASPFIQEQLFSKIREKMGLK